MAGLQLQAKGGMNAFIRNGRLRLCAGYRFRRTLMPCQGARHGGGYCGLALTAGDRAAARTDQRADLLAAEEPLGIRVNGTALTMTMRTPGDDVELAAGFLVGEAVVRAAEDIAEIKICDGTTCGHGDHGDGEIGNIVDIAARARRRGDPGGAAQPS